MELIDRRSALVLGAVVAAPVFALPRPAGAAMYGPDEGKEILPGIRQIDLGEWPVSFAAYKKVKVTDYVSYDRR